MTSWYSVWRSMATPAPIRYGSSSWHEMFNDVVGEVPVALAYCTLCGSGILYETQVPSLPTPFVFGSSRISLSVEQG